MAKMAWLVYLLALFLFAGMLQAAWARMGIVAMVMFVLMYIVIEASMPLLLRNFAAATRASRVDILWRWLIRVVFLPGPGVLLLQWRAEDETLGLAVQLHPDAARGLFDRLKSALPKDVSLRVIDSGSLSAPPSEAKR